MAKFKARCNQKKLFYSLPILISFALIFSFAYIFTQSFLPTYFKPDSTIRPLLECAFWW